MTPLTTKNQPLSTGSYSGRLAPSPTGLLHLGHARTFWIAYERARRNGGTLWLRNEDLDPQRSRDAFAQAMRDDLRWLGIAWDGEVRQRERILTYREAMQQLLRAGYAYPCTCSSRKDLQEATQAPHEDDDEPLYLGTCRPETPGGEMQELRPERNYRFRIPTSDPITFVDGSAGPQTFTPGVDFGDFLIWRKALGLDPEDAGLPSYQLACVLDDAAMGITEVVRGRDLLKSTARQILLQRALGLRTPGYFHPDLVRDSAGHRLAKRHDALSLRALRDFGYTAEEVRATLL